MSQQPMIPTLTDREQACLQLMASGMNNVALAKYMGVNESSVRRLVNTIFEKLDVVTRVKAVVEGIRHHLITADTDDGELFAEVKIYRLEPGGGKKVFIHNTHQVRMGLAEGGSDPGVGPVRDGKKRWWGYTMQFAYSDREYE